ncbi:MAG: hypothetical protein AB7O59_20095 [Pirellulales bacterium]
MKTLGATLRNRWHVGQRFLRTTLARGGRDGHIEHVDRPVREGTLLSPAAQSAASPFATALQWCCATSLIVFGPLALASLLLWVLCGGALWDCVPVWHDEGWYWNEMAVYESVGWDGGYTVIHEWPARAEWVRFGTHGPFVPALYGTLARAFGLHYASIPLLNAGMLVAASLFWVACCRPSTRQAWVTAFIVLTFWPLVLYVPTSMQEVMHLAIAFVVAAWMVLLIRSPGNRWLLAGGLIAVALAAQLRVTWAFVAVPLVWVAWRPANWRQWTALAAASGMFVGLLYVEAIMLYSPYPNFMKDVLDRAGQSPAAACGMVVVHVLKSIVRYLAPNHDTFVQIGFRYQTLMVVGAAIYFFRRRRLLPQTAGNANASGMTVTGSAPTGTAPAVLAPVAFGVMLLTLFTIVGFIIAFYDVFNWRDYRVVAPHFLLALLVLVACGARDWLGGYAVVSVLLAALALPQFAEFHRPRVEFDTARVAAFSEQVGQVVKYLPNGSGWDNTLLMDIDVLDSPLLMGLPRGIGISVSRYWNLQAWPPRSKYLLLDRQRAAQMGIPSTFEKVAETELGDIYARR